MGPCDLIRSFGLPEDVEGAVGHLVGENTYPFDVMKVSATRRGAPVDPVRDERRAGGVPRRHGAERRAAAALARRRPAVPRVLVRLRHPAVRDVTLKLDNREHELRAWSVIVGNGQFDAGLRMSPRSFPGDGVLDVLAFVGPKGEAYRLLPRIFRHGDHVPDDGIKELRDPHRRADRCGPADAGRDRRRVAGHHPRRRSRSSRNRSGSSCERGSVPATAQCPRRRAAGRGGRRRRRPRALARTWPTSAGTTRCPSSDPRSSIVRADRDPRCSCRSSRCRSPRRRRRRQVVEVVGWADGDDPYARAAGLLGDARRVALGDRTWAVHVLGLQAAVAGCRPSAPRRPSWARSGR